MRSTSQDFSQLSCSQFTVGSYVDDAKTVPRLRQLPRSLQNILITSSDLTLRISRRNGGMPARIVFFVTGRARMRILNARPRSEFCGRANICT